MGVANATITGKIGPDRTITAQVFSDVKEIKFDFPRDVFSIKYGAAPERIIDFDYDVTATVTFTISGNTATITIA